MKKTIILFISLISFAVYSQDSDYSVYFKSGTKLNVNDLDQLLGQVYLEKTQEIKQTVRYEDYSELLSQRLAIVQIPDGKIGSLTSTNDLPLNIDYNSELTYDKDFNPSTFNPFKYDMNFFPNSPSVSYRIGSSDYIIIILAK